MTSGSYDPRMFMNLDANYPALTITQAARRPAPISVAGRYTDTQRPTERKSHVSSSKPRPPGARKPPRARDLALSPAAQAQSGRLVAVGPGCARAGATRQQAD